MNILIVNTIQYNINGIANVISSLVKNLKLIDSSNNFFITSYGEMNEYYKNIFLKSNAKIIDVPNRKKIFKYQSFLKKIIKKEKIDIVHVHGNSATMIIECIIFHQMKIKIITHNHNTKSNHNILNFLIKPIFDNFVDIKLACSKEAGNYVYKNKFIVIRNGINIEKFKFNIYFRDELRKNIGIANDEKIFLNVGIFNEQKNQKFIIDFVEHNDDRINKNFRFMFIGSGIEKEKIIKKISNNFKYRFIFLEETIDVYKYYSVADCFLLPSLFESFGLVLLEAQINGLKCICSNKISKSSNISKELIYLKLDETIWTKSIMNIDFTRNEFDSKKFIEYDEKYVAKKMLDIYLSCYEEKQ